MSAYASQSITKSESQIVKKNPIVPVSQLDSSKIIITDPYLKKEDKKYYSYVLYRQVDEKSITCAFETPLLRNVFGIKFYGEDTITEDQKNYSMVLTYLTKDVTPELDNENNIFKTFLDGYKDTAIKFLVKHSDIIVKKQLNQIGKDVLEHMLDSLFSFPVKQKVKPDGTFYPVNITVKIPKNRVTYVPEIGVFRDNSRDTIKVDSMDELIELFPAGSTCKLIIKPKISFVNKKMHVTFTLVQIKGFTTERVTISKEDYAFSDSGNIKSSSTNPSSSVSNFGTETVVVDSDEEIDVSDA
jgi:hypothetical protein